MSGGCVEGAVYELAQEVVADRRPGAAALRRHRRRRVRRRADLRRHPRRLRREGRPGDLPRARRGRRRHRGGRPVAVATVVEQPARRGSAAGWSSGRTGSTAALGSRRAWTTRSRDDARGLLAAGPQRDAAPTAPTASAAARASGLRLVVRARRRGCWSSAPSTSPPRSPGSGAFLGYHVTVCDARPVFATATRFPEADEVVVEWPHRYLAAEARGRPDRRAHRDLRAHPRPEVRRAAARGRAAAARGRLRRRDGLAAHPRRPAGPAARGRADRGGAGPAVLADRARPRRAHPGGDRGLDRRRDHRAALGRRGRAARGPRGPDPHPTEPVEEDRTAPDRPARSVPYGGPADSATARRERCRPAGPGYRAAPRAASRGQRGPSLAEARRRATP